MSDQTQPSSELTPRSKRRNRTRERILKASARLFAARGFESVSMRDIAEAADVGLPTIYNYFKDKSDVYRLAVLDEQAAIGRHYGGELLRIEKGEDFMKWLALLVSGDHKDFGRLLYREILTDRDDVIKEMARPFQGYYENLKAKLNAVRAGSGDGALPILLLAATLGYEVIHPFRAHLKGYAPALPQSDLDAAERQAIIRHLYALICPPKATVQETESNATPADSEVELLRNIVLELSIEKARLRAILDADGDGADTEKSN